MDRRKLFIVIGGLAVVVIAIGAAGFWYFFLRGSEPPPVSLDAAATAAAGGGASADVGDPKGTWSVTADGTSFAGYRVNENLAAFGSRTAVGRTTNLQG